MTSVFAHPAIQTLCLLLFAALVDALWRWPESRHPLTVYRFLAERMGQKVLPTSQDALVQHAISSSLGALVLIAPLVVVLAILVYMAEYPVFFEAIILIGILDYGTARYRFNRVLASVGKNKKVLTRETLAPMVARDCTTLTDVGVAKAAIESLLLRFYYQYCGVIFWFLLTGPIGALIYRLLLTTSWQWHYRRPGYQQFARPIRKLVKWLTFIPTLLAALIMLLATDFPAALGAVRASPARDFTSLLLAAFGGGNHVQLGGPAIYSERKFRYPRVGGSKQVQYSDMVYCKRAIDRAMLLTLAFASLSLVLLWYFTRHSTMVA